MGCGTAAGAGAGAARTHGNKARAAGSA
jgi:hypothetical protein